MTGFQRNVLRWMCSSERSFHTSLDTVLVKSWLCCQNVNLIQTNCHTTMLPQREFLRVTFAMSSTCSGNETDDRRLRLLRTHQEMLVLLMPRPSILREDKTFLAGVNSRRK